jgi:hypothetical protein
LLIQERNVPFGSDQSAAVLQSYFNRKSLLLYGPRRPFAFPSELDSRTG